MKVVKWLDEHFEEAMLVLLLVLICCVELAQVVCRNVPFLAALKWSDEFCRFCWIWTVFLSLPYTIRKGNMLRVNVLLDLFPTRLRSVLGLVVEGVVCGAMVLLGVHSVSVVRGIMTSGETSPAMLWPMWVVYSVLLLGFFLGALRSGQQIVLKIRRFGQSEKSTVEQTMEDAASEVEAGKKAEGGSR